MFEIGKISVKKKSEGSPISVIIKNEGSKSYTIHPHWLNYDAC